MKVMIETYTTAITTTGGLSSRSIVIEKDLEELITMGHKLQELLVKDLHSKLEDTLNQDNEVLGYQELGIKCIPIGGFDTNLRGDEFISQLRGLHGRTHMKKKVSIQNQPTISNSSPAMSSGNPVKDFIDDVQSMDWNEVWELVLDHLNGRKLLPYNLKVDVRNTNSERPKYSSFRDFMENGGFSCAEEYYEHGYIKEEEPSGTRFSKLESEDLVRQSGDTAFIIWNYTTNNSLEKELLDSYVEEYYFTSPYKGNQY